jgi:hypothetical protein
MVFFAGGTAAWDGQDKAAIKKIKDKVLINMANPFWNSSYATDEAGNRG